MGTPNSNKQQQPQQPAPSNASQAAASQAAANLAATANAQPALTLPIGMLAAGGRGGNGHTLLGLPITQFCHALAQWRAVNGQLQLTPTPTAAAVAAASLPAKAAGRAKLQYPGQGIAPAAVYAALWAAMGQQPTLQLGSIKTALTDGCNARYSTALPGLGMQKAKLAQPIALTQQQVQQFITLAQQGAALAAAAGVTIANLP